MQKDTERDREVRRESGAEKIREGADEKQKSWKGLEIE